MNWETSKKPLVIAHRGYTQNQTENTLEAVEAAMRLGADGVEVDLRLSADGELVVFHDDTLQRPADCRESVEAMTLSDLKQVLLRGKNHLPTLKELLDLVRDKILLNLEIKTVRYFSQAVERRLLETLKSFGLGPSILISSFHPLPLIRLRRLAPQLKRGYLVDTSYFKTRPRKIFSRWIAPFSLNPSRKMMSSELVQKTHAAGQQIFVWTVNGEDVKKALSLELDGIFTDEPDKLLDALGRPRHQ